MLSLETIAYEEAGHAVAAIILDVPFIDVMISALRGTVRRDGERKFEDRYFIVSLAGPAARRRFDPESAWMDQKPGCDIDQVRAAIPTLQEVYGSWSTFESLNAEAEQLTDVHWLKIKRVAQALLAQLWRENLEGIQVKTLSADAVRAVLTNSQFCQSTS